jgi:hypothetical protein
MHCAHLSVSISCGDLKAPWFLLANNKRDDERLRSRQRIAQKDCFCYTFIIAGLRGCGLAINKTESALK